MLTVLRALTRLISKVILWFILIVGVLAIFSGLPERVTTWKKEAEQENRRADTLEQTVDKLDREAPDIVSAANQEIDRLGKAGQIELEKAKNDVVRRRDEAKGRILSPGQLALAGAGGQTDRIVASYRAELLEFPLLDRAAGLIDVRLGNLRARASRASQLEKLSDEIRTHNADVATYNQGVRKRNALQQSAKAQWRNPLCSRAALPQICENVRRIRALDSELAKRQISIKRQKRVIERKKLALRALRLQNEAVTDSKRIADNALKQVSREAQEASRQASGLVWNKIADAFRRYGWQAFFILIGAILLPIALKAFSFWIIAPMASRAAPLRLRSGGPASRAAQSGIAVDVMLDRDTELLVRSSVQGRSDGIEAEDKLFLKNSMFLACIAAGLINLQRFRTSGQGHVTVTSDDDEHYEVALVDVPSGGALILQPRALVGVVKPRNRTLMIDRPWRVRWLISWLTFQFRYIIFRGPCTLIVRGRRGVHLKAADDGGIVNKRQVLGFDAGLSYSAARSASFRPYLFGRMSLFDDRFSGNGSYLCEARSASAGKTSVWGRGLKGIGDALLSAAGI